MSELLALEVRDTPEGEPRTAYVERAALAALVIEVIDAVLPGLRIPSDFSPSGARPRVPVRRKAEGLGVEAQYETAAVAGEPKFQTPAIVPFGD
jgi:hypothetical protein